MRILVTGGAGFVGSNLAILFKRDRADAQVVAFDNLHRAGSELAPARLRAHGVSFVHGDVRCLDDLGAAGPFDLLIDCAAEPSVQAGAAGGQRNVIDVNLLGTVNCLEAARRHGADVVFLSTSRVYPVACLAALPLAEAGSRFVIEPGQSGTGWSGAGIAEDFPLAGYRSFYGTTKLASEMLIEEYRAIYGLRAVIDRCGVISGPWQMGKIDQGMVVLWAAAHLAGRPLQYFGYGGRGLQVRDVLHVADLYELLKMQLQAIAQHSGRVYNVGGGPENAVSLAELTRLCAERADQRVPVAGREAASPLDVPWYVTDNRAVTAATGWRPKRDIEALLDEVFDWLRAEKEALVGIVL